MVHKKHFVSLKAKLTVSILVSVGVCFFILNIVCFFVLFYALRQQAAVLLPQVTQRLAIGSITLFLLAAVLLYVLISRIVAPIGTVAEKFRKIVGGPMAQHMNEAAIITAALEKKSEQSDEVQALQQKVQGLRNDVISLRGETLKYKNKQRELEEALQDKQDLLIQIGREIRMPMNALMGMNELILQETLPQDIRTNALGIKNISVAVMSIIHDALMFSKTESGKWESPQLGDLNHIVIAPPLVTMTPPVPADRFDMPLDIQRESAVETVVPTVVSTASLTAPDARVLMVDDVMTNLKIGKGLLEPYGVELTLCASGREAVSLVANNRYDLVFMDHMMPEMDGLETTKHIRAMEGEYFQLLPIIALTADEAPNIERMFIQNGMNDYLPKPLETAKLNQILEAWLPADKKIKADTKHVPEEKSEFVAALRSVPDLSVDRVISAIGGSEQAYEKIVRISIQLLPENIARLEQLLETDIALYAIEVHGVKGVLNNIGAYALAKQALTLEELAKAGDVAGCKMRHQDFIDQLVRFSNTVADLMNQTFEPSREVGDKVFLTDSLPQIQESIDFFSNTDALDIISTASHYTYGQAIDEVLVELTHAFECFDFDSAAILVNKLKGELGIDE